MIEFDNARRRLVIAAGAALLSAGSDSKIVQAAGKHEQSKEKETEKKVSAVEDLMREHGVIRRAILIYRQAALKLRTEVAVVPDLLHRTALLFRSFGEDYHEKKLEETHIFPTIKKVGGPAAAYVDVLLAQHQRGREITDYVLALTSKGAIGISDEERLERALESVALMYAHHAAREDTIVFPAWKDALSAHQLDDMGELFEEIEHKQFGKDGFEDALAQIASIEAALGIADIAQFTPPPPPKG